MPLYEYLCESCGARTEFLQRFSDAPEVVCASCGGPMRKLPSAPSFQFKGSGWYLTDYARKSGEKEEAAPRGAAEKSADKAGDKSADSGAARSESQSETSGGARDSTASSSAESAPANTAPAAPAAPAKEKPAPSGGE